MRKPGVQMLRRDARERVTLKGALAENLERIMQNAKQNEQKNQWRTGKTCVFRPLKRRSEM